MTIVWGTASGKGSTSGAARGAFTNREYASHAEAKAAILAGDWLQVLSVRGGS